MIELIFNSNQLDPDSYHSLFHAFYEQATCHVSFIPIKSHIEIIDGQEVTVYDEVKIESVSIDSTEAEQ